MRRRLLVGSTFVILTLACGCNQPGTAMMRYETNGLARMSQAPFAGQYALYEKNSSDPDVTYTLAKGDPIGFEESNGKAYAVAGKHKDELKPKRTYYWRELEE